MRASSRSVNIGMVGNYYIHMFSTYFQEPSAVHSFKSATSCGSAASITTIHIGADSMPVSCPTVQTGSGPSSLAVKEVENLMHEEGSVSRHLWCNHTDRTETEKLGTGPNGIGPCLSLCVVCTVPHITI